MKQLPCERTLCYMFYSENPSSSNSRDVDIMSVLQTTVAYTETACEYWSHNTIAGLLVIIPVLFSLQYWTDSENEPFLNFGEKKIQKLYCLETISHFICMHHISPAVSYDHEGVKSKHLIKEYGYFHFS